MRLIHELSFICSRIVFEIAIATSSAANCRRPDTGSASLLAREAVNYKKLSQKPLLGETKRVLYIIPNLPALSLSNGFRDLWCSHSGSLSPF
jgi:hypothetical protein